jgi:hypothetical protein
VLAYWVHAKSIRVLKTDETARDDPWPARVIVPFVAITGLGKKTLGLVRDRRSSVTRLQGPQGEFIVDDYKYR